MVENPFLNRGSLAGLLARRGQLMSTLEGASPSSSYLQRGRIGQLDEAINQFQRPRPRPQPMPQRPMMPRPRPMQPQPAPMPMPQPAPMPMMPGIMGPAGPGSAPTVTVGTGGAPSYQPPPMMGRPAPSFGGFWNTLGLGGMPQMGGGYGGYGGYGGGFGMQQPYRPMQSQDLRTTGGWNRGAYQPPMLR